MRLAAHQPNYLPNLGFFSKMKEVDLFVIVTNLQFEKHEGWQQRHKIATKNGDLWLTVPVLGSQNQLIKDVLIDNKTDWRQKHKRTLQMTYSKGIGNKFLNRFDLIFSKEWVRLVDFNIAVILLVKDILGITTKVVVDEDVSGVKHTLLMNICKKYGASSYVSGVGAKEYMTSERLDEMEKNGITHVYVSKNLTAVYPYSTIHYLLSKGKDFVLDVI